MDADTNKCSQCPKSYPKKGSLWAHMKNVHSGMKYECDICEKEYASKTTLTAHKKTIHGPKKGQQNSGTKKIGDKVDIPVSKTVHASQSPNNGAEKMSSVQEKANASSAKKEEKGNHSKKATVGKKVPVQMEQSEMPDVARESKPNMRQSQEFPEKLPPFMERGRKQSSGDATNKVNEASESMPLLKENGKKSDKRNLKVKDEKLQLSSKVVEKDLKTDSMSSDSYLKNVKEAAENEFYDNDKQEKTAEKKVFNDIKLKQRKNQNTKIKLDLNSSDSKKRIDIKSEENAFKENATPTLEDEAHAVQTSSFASDCPINPILHEGGRCEDKQFNKADELTQTEVDNDEKDSCLWAHCGNLSEEEPLEFTKTSAGNSKRKLDSREGPKENSTLDHHSGEREHNQSGVGEESGVSSPKQSQVLAPTEASNKTSDKPSQIKELQNNAQNSDKLSQIKELQNQPQNSDKLSQIKEFQNHAQNYDKLSQIKEYQNHAQNSDKPSQIKEYQNHAQNSDKPIQIKEFQNHVQNSGKPTLIKEFQNHAQNSDKPIQIKKPQNGAQHSEVSSDSFVVPKTAEKADIPWEATIEAASNNLAEEFVCDTIGCKKKLATKEDLDEHKLSSDGQQRKCMLCMKVFANENCLKYHKEQNCGVDSESDEDEDEDLDDEEEVDEDEMDDDFDQDHEIESLKKENEKAGALGKMENGGNEQIALKPREQSKVYDTIQNEKLITDYSKSLSNPIKNDNQNQENNTKLPAQNANYAVLETNAQHSAIDTIQMKTEDVRSPTTEFIKSSPISAQHPTKSGSQSPKEYPVKIQSETNDGLIPSKDSIQTQNNSVQTPSENAKENPKHPLNLSQTPVNSVQHASRKSAQHLSQGSVPMVSNYDKHPMKSANQLPTNEIKQSTKNTNQLSTNKIKPSTENANQMSANDAKLSTENDLPVNGRKRPMENINEAPMSRIGNPNNLPSKRASNERIEMKSQDSSIVKSTDNGKSIRPDIQKEDPSMGIKNKAPKEKPLTLKEKQQLYRFEQQLKHFQLNYSPEFIIQMSQENFDNLGAQLHPNQQRLCQMIRDSGLKLPSKSVPANILKEKKTCSNSMQNSEFPQQMLKRKGEAVKHEMLSKKIHLESKPVKEEEDDSKSKLDKLKQSVLKGLNVGNNKENYEVIIEDGKLKLRIIGNPDDSSESLDEDKEDDDADVQENPKWKTHSDLKKDIKTFSNGGPSILEGWKMCFQEEKMEGMKVMVAKYMDPEGRLHKRGTNGYDQIPNFQN